MRGERRQHLRSRVAPVRADRTGNVVEGTIDELMFTIHAHPTISEAMLDAYAAVEGMAINA